MVVIILVLNVVLRFVDVRSNAIKIQEQRICFKKLLVLLLVKVYDQIINLLCEGLAQIVGVKGMTNVQI